MCFTITQYIFFSTPGNIQPNASNVPSCSLGPYGCCDDKVTFAKGPDMEGCPPQESQSPVQTTTLASPASAQAQSQCQKEQNNARESGAADIFVPECEPSGLFKEIQCYTYPVIGREDCWCVNQNTGKEIPGTRISGMTPNCNTKGNTMFVCFHICTCFNLV